MIGMHVIVLYCIVLFCFVLFWLRLWLCLCFFLTKSNNFVYSLCFRNYPEISSVDHLWVSRMWIRDLGLSQYCSAFEAQMIDGRLLNVLTRKDMEKYLNVSKKFHQVRWNWGNHMP